MSTPHPPPHSPHRPKSSITPQRKHRKLLKDGSGSEVWPESLERIFIEGLHKYWESPYATYSRGRSRWRNQFLVDFLQTKGITRSKKQVASHIQVLRNMWKGEPEFQLVAGGDELCPDPDQPVHIKMEDMAEGLVPFDSDEVDTLSSASTSSPSYSPLAVKSEFPSSPLQHSSLLFTPESYSPATHLAFPNPSLSYSPSSPASTDLGLPTSPPSIRTLQLQSVAAVQQKPVATTSDYPSDGKPPTLHTYSYYRNAPNRVTNICLLADGMPPLAYALQSLKPALLCIKLAMPSINDVRSPTTLHGFRGNLCLAYVWNSYAKCTTRLYANSTCTSEETVALEVSSIDVGTVIALLPESRLTRCRWLDSSLDHMLTQEIVVDNQSLLHIVYQLDRGTVLPSAQVLDCQPYSAALLASWTSWMTLTARPAFDSQSRRLEFRPPYALASAISRSS